MTLRTLIPLLENPLASGALDTPITHLAYDSRQVAPGSAFFALRGSSADGHQFITKALSLGASVIIAEQAPPADSNTPWIHVPNTRRALASAAAAFYQTPAADLKIAGVTGTNGKTTTAFILHHLLNTAQLRAGLIGTLFYDIGGTRLPATHTTPESLEIQQLLSQMRDNGCRACAMETSSHALHQHRTHAISFAAGIFTNLTQDHLDYHQTLEKYFAAKALLFDQIAAQPKGSIIINQDDTYGRRLIIRHQDSGRLITFGYSANADYRAINPRTDFTGTSFELEYKKRSFLVRLPLIGDFNVANALGALAAAHAMGLNLREAIANLRSIPQVPGRLERVNDHQRFAVFVDYAHTPDALTNVLQTLRSLKPARILTVFGCGGDRDAGKRPKMAAAAEAGSDLCILTSDNPRTEDPEAIIAQAAKGFSRRARYLSITDRRAAIQGAIEQLQADDILLIAGKGHEDYQDINGVKHPFDDRKIARQLIQQIRSTQAAAEAEAEPNHQR